MKLGMPVCPFGWGDVYDDPHSMINGMVSDVYGVAKWPDQCRDVWQNHHWTSAQITTGNIEEKFDSWVSDKSIWSTWHAYILYDILWCMINDTWIYMIYIYIDILIYDMWYMIYDIWYMIVPWNGHVCHVISFWQTYLPSIIGKGAHILTTRYQARTPKQARCYGVSFVAYPLLQLCALKYSTLPVENHKVIIYKWEAHTFSIKFRYCSLP